jgi:hypothetical protein
MKKIISFMAMAIITLSCSRIYAQVTIGKLAPPDHSAVLQVISPENNKGVLIPELTTEQRDSIVNPADGLGIYNTDENCFNYYDLLQSAWTSVCGGAGAAKFTFICDSIVANGTYIKGTPLTGANYLSIPIKVTKAGAFDILGNSGNGYSFSYSGVVTDSGKYIVNVQGLGTPQIDQADNVMITGGADTCYTGITVQTNVATYSLDCASISVGGQYVKGTPLDNSNFISVRVTIISPVAPIVGIILRRLRVRYIFRTIWR